MRLYRLVPLISVLRFQQLIRWRAYVRSCEEKFASFVCPLHSVVLASSVWVQDLRLMMTPRCRQQNLLSAVVALHRSWLLVALYLSLGCVFCATGTSEHSKDSGFNQQGYIGDVGLGEEWGLPDAVATVGRLFCYQLPKCHTTLGNFTNYKVNIKSPDVCSS